MNEENTQVKITMPLIDDIELQNIDTFYNDIVSEYTKVFVKEKEQVIAQRLMMNLQKENTELKEKCLKAVADYETTMFEKEQLNSLVNSCQEEIRRLKKQLEDTNEELELVRCDLHNRTSERDGYYRNIEILENQQKEFIEYMNKTIEELECDDVSDEEMKGYLIQRIDIFKEILSKFKK